MKAALEAWGSTRNLFHQGFARVTEDPAIVEATMARPGVVLRRPVGTKGRFSETAELPTHLALGDRSARGLAIRQKVAPRSAKPIDERQARAAAQAFERERKRREAKERREEAAEAREQDRRERAIAAAQAALEESRRDHGAKISEIEKARAALDRKAAAEEVRWRKEQEALESALRRARSSPHLRLVK